MIKKSAIRRIITELRGNADSIDGTGCTFWACKGHKSMRIESMITCTNCRAIIVQRREANKLEKLLKAI